MQPAQTYFEGQWHEGNVPLFGAEEYASWLGMSVFDGIRAFDGLFPDADEHCKRSLRSAEALGLKTKMLWSEIWLICSQGIRRFEEGSHLYIRVEFWDRTKYAHSKSCCSCSGDDEAGFAVVIEEIPLTRDGFTANMSPFRRCEPNQAPTNAKASCLYPQGIIAAKRANKDGFDDAVLCSPDGKVAEFTMSNLFYVKGNVIVTPVPNGTFLNGITRQRMINLFQLAGYKVEVRPVYPAELDHADEIFSTGNANKIQPINKYKDRELPREFADLGWKLYLEYAENFKV